VALVELVPLESRRSRSSALRRSRDELAFLPAALEIVETPASPAARTTAFVLTMLIASALAWSCLAHLDVVAVAEGKVIPIGQVKLVQPLEPGTVRALHVDEGDHVTAGQVLIEIDPTEQKANLEQARYDRLQALFDAESARVLLTGDLSAEFQVPPGADSVLAEAVKQQTRDGLAKYLASMASFESQVEEKRAAEQGAGAQIDKNEDSRPILEERYQGMKELNDKGFAQATNWIKARQDLLDSTAEIESLKQKQIQTEAEIKSLENKRAETDTAFRADASDKRLKALQKVVQLEQQISKETMREDKRKLVAPVSGTVLGLKANTIGGVVTAADTLMTIVPDDTVVEIEGQLQNMDIGFVKEGMPVEIKLETFPFTRYGTVPATVRRIGRDSVKPQTAANPSNGTPKDGKDAGTELTYPVRIALMRATITVEGRPQLITPGMKAVAEIKTHQRRVISYLMDQVFGTLWTAGRER